MSNYRLRFALRNCPRIGSRPPSGMRSRALAAAATCIALVLGAFPALAHTVMPTLPIRLRPEARDLITVADGGAPPCPADITARSLNTNLVLVYAYDTVTHVNYDQAWTITYAYDANGNITSLTSAPGTTGVEEGFSVLPRTYELGQNRPNPFDGVTKMQYSLPRSGSVRLEGFDVTGHEVRTLMNAIQPAGYHTVVWDGLDDAGNRASGGMYMWKLIAGDTVRMRKGLLIR